MPPQLLLHPRLVAEEISGAGVGARHAKLSAHLRQWDLEGLEDSKNPMEFTVAAFEQPRRVDQLAGVKPVGHRNRVGKEFRVVALRRLLKDSQKTYSLQT